MIPVEFRLMQTFLLVNILILTVTLSASPAQCTVYTWRDTSGIDHYTNREHEIPARYRTMAKPLYPEPGDTTLQNANPVKPDNTSTPKISAPDVSVLPVPTDLGGLPALSTVKVPPAKNVTPVIPVLRGKRHRGATSEE